MARVVDLGTVIDVLRGKLEFESGEEGREQAVLEHLLRRATADTAQRLLGGIDVGPLVTAIEDGSPVTTGERVSARDVLAALPEVPAVAEIQQRLEREVRRPARRRDRVGARGAVSGQAHRQGLRRRRNRLWLNPVRGAHPDTPPTPAVPIRWHRRSICARRSSRSARTSWRAPRRAGRCRSCCGAAPQNMRGADKLAAEANRRRRELLQRNNLDGTLQEIKKLLDEAVLAERKELARALDDDARFGELQIESLSPSPAKAVQELSDYDWRSAGGAREVRADQGSARPRDARPALRRHEAGAGERHRRGPSARQRDARRPQRPAGQARQRRGHPAGLRRLHGQARRVLPGEPAERRRAAGLAGQAGRRRAAVPQQPVRSSSAPSWMRWRSRLSARRR